MEFTCKSKQLKDAIGVVEKAIAAKSSLPVLENVYLELENGSLTLRGNNLEIGIENNISIEQPTQNGKVLLKAKYLLFFEISLIFRASSFLKINFGLNELISIS